MKKKSILFSICIVALLSLLFSSCATIVGGSTYNARVVIQNNHPKAQIIYNGEIKGYGSASFRVKRNDANKFSLTIREDGFQDEVINYTTRTFRTAAFIGSILLWTGITSTGIPIPYGPVIDLACGSIWKPDIHHPDIKQESTKNFSYLINYNSTLISKVDSTTQISTISTSNLIDVIYLKNGNIVKGLILEQIPNVQIKLQSIDGQNYVFPMDLIEKIAKEQTK